MRSSYRDSGHIWVNGVTLNLPKFQFCQDTAEFAGLKLTPTGICPSDSILAGIRDFPQPKDLTSARAWFGLVNQVAWAYSNTTVMQPFRDLVKPNSKFFWDHNLSKIFEESKQVIISCVEEGVICFDLDRVTVVDGKQEFMDSYTSLNLVHSTLLPR